METLNAHLTFLERVLYLGRIRYHHEAAMRIKFPSVLGIIIAATGRKSPPGRSLYRASGKQRSSTE